MKYKLVVVSLLSWLGLLNSPITAEAQPAVTTLAATSITTNSGTIHGTVNPLGASTTAYYEYGLTTNYGFLGGFTNLPSSTNTLTLPGLAVNSFPDAAGSNWFLSSAPSNRNWNCIASSADGRRLAAVENSQFGQINISTNRGLTWTPTGGFNYWKSVASSIDGTRLVAGSNGGGLWVSTNGGGVWMQTGIAGGSWYSVCASTDGMRMAAVNQNSVYTSTNGGLTWVQSGAPVSNWVCVASSANGMRLSAGIYGGGIWTSTNGGLAWTKSCAPDKSWNSIASSADGLRLVAGGDSAYLTTSADGGLTWTEFFLSAGNVTSSADGNRLAWVNGSSISVSTNGVTASVFDLPGAGWSSLAFSADGSQLAAVIYGGGIYTSTAGPGSGLTPGTIIHYRLVGMNSAGITRGNDLTFTTSPTAPSASTLAASGITATAATLNGAVNPRGSATKAYFRYGLTTNYGSFTATNSLPATNATLLVSSVISGLTPNMTYYYQLVCSNILGTVLGVQRSFTSAFPVPVVATLAASGITATSATLNGTVNPNGGATAAYFEYGLTTNYGSFSATNSLPGTNVTLSVSILLSSLAPATTYHFRIVGGNNGGTARGVDRTLTTLIAAPTLFTYPASDYDGASATLSGTVNPNGAATSAYFEYGLTTNYGSFGPTNNLPALTTMTFLSDLIDGLPLAATIHFRLVAGNSAGTTAGVDQIISKPPQVFTGVLPWEGLDLNGTFVYAANVGDNGAPGLIGDADFTTDSVAGVTVTLTLNPIFALSSWADPDFGSTTPGLRLALAMSSIRTTTAPSSLVVYLNGLQIGHSYQLQLMFIERDSDRAFDISVNGTLIVPNFRLRDYGYDGTAIVVPHFFTATATTAVIELGGGTAGYNNNPILSAFTLEDLVMAPAVTTLAASAITATNARLNGSVNPNGGATTAYFQYGLTTNYGSFSATNSLAATNGTLSVSNLIGSLAPGTTYQYRLVGVNSAGTNAGANRTFTTGASAPTVTTLAASGITAANGTLNGTVNPNGAATTAYFRYGLTTNYGSFSATNTLVATNTALSVSNLISGLAPGTTYHFRIVGLNSSGTNTGTDLTFTTSASAPTVTTLAASSITASNAVLNGTVDPNGPATTAYFQYGLTTNYGSFSATNSLAATNTPLSVLNLVGSLAPGTTYHFRIVGLNSSGTNTGADLTFTTGAAAPTVTTLAASSITVSNAVLNGTVDPNGPATTAYFQYGLTTNYGSFSATNSLAATNTPLSVLNLVGSLAPGTTYHFRIVGLNSSGTNTGADLTFTTGAAAPTVTTLAASSITVSNAVLNGTVDPNGPATTAYFQYGLTTNYGSFSATNSLAATNTPLSVLNLVGSLAPATTYHFRLVATNSAGTSVGGNLTFTTGAAAPTVTTLAASSITASNAVLNGTVDPNGPATTAYFQYGLTTNYGSFSATNSLAATNTPLSVLNLVGSLAPATTYHFRLVATNSAGTSVGGNLTFTTLAGAPTVTTLAASSITASNAVLNGTVDPNGPATTAYFQYGLTTNYGSFSATNTLPVTNVSLSVPSLIGDLTPGTTYHFRLVAANGAGTNAGVNLTFTTSPLAPTVTTLAASSVTATNASLNGSVNPGNGATAAYFQYGLTTGYGSFSATNSLAATNTTLSVSNLIGSLTSGTTYHFRLVGSNSAGNTLGSDLLFTTPSSQAVSFMVNGPFPLPGGAFQLTFTNLSGLGFTVLAATNVTLPSSNWTVLGAALEGPDGQYEFTDSQTTTNAQRFYRVLSP